MERLSVNTPSAAMHPTDPTDDLLRTALDLAARRDRVRAVAGEQATSRALVRETLESLGLDPTLALDAEHHLEARRAQRRRTRERAGLIVTGGIAAAIVAVVAIVMLHAPDPWSDSLTDTTRWSLVKNDETSAAFTRTPDGPGEVATVFIDDFGKDDRGQWPVELVGQSLPDFARHEQLHLEAQGTLKRVRIVLNGAPDERWVSPTLTLGETWQTHTLTLRSFEHQRLERRGWDDVRRSERRLPHDIGSVALVLGAPVNSLDRAGALRIRSLVVE
jgi:hypothetical protein